MTAQTIAMACDHGGLNLKELLKADLTALGYEVLDLGTDSADSVDYPDFGAALAKAIQDGRAHRGIAICGSGIGISIAVNRHAGVRAALVTEPLAARLSREHNDANVICMGERLIGPDLARECVKVFLATEFEGGRHARRVGKLG